MRSNRFTVILALLVSAIFAATASDALASQTTFNYTGAVQTYQVPDHVHSLSVTAAGAAGGTGIYPGGRGATATATVPVTPGSTLYVYVGGNGGGGGGTAGGFNGGGDASGYNYGASGGGASDVRTVQGDLTTRLLVAAGGGGGGSGLGTTANGGNGGGPDGAAGGGNNGYGNGGGGGTQSAGGAGGWSNVGGNGHAGTFGQGGQAGLYFYPPYYGAGAGGGGYYGGGGGGSFAAGGGGSSYAEPTAKDVSYGLASSPSVSITTQPVTIDSDAYDFGDVQTNSKASHTFTVSNIGSLPQQVSFATSGSAFSAGSQSTCGGVLAAGSSCTIVVDFAAGATPGAQSGGLQVDVTGSDSLSVPLSAKTVDTIAPAAPAITSGPQGTVTDTTARFEFSGEAGASFECSLDGGAYALCTSPQTYSDLAAGDHTFRVRQTDSAGNTGPAASQSFTIQAASAPAASTPPPSNTTAPDAKDLDIVVAKLGTISHGRVPVGCRIDDGQLSTCTVRAYAGRARVGSGSAKFKGGELGTVRVKLSARGLRLVRRVGGVKLTYVETATTDGGKALRARGSSRVLPLTAVAVPTDGTFPFDSATLNRYGRRFVRSLAGQLTGAKRVVCTGYTDSTGPAAYNKRLGRARAKAFCAQLHAAGIRPHRSVHSFGERDPRATNRTAAGRALNRRIELVVRYH